MSNIYTAKQIKVFIRLQKKLRRRYQPVRAPYKNKGLPDFKFKMFYYKMDGYNIKKDIGKTPIIIFIILIIFIMHHKHYLITVLYNIS
jgi:hypothetical protein